jgi:hypothetical protein
VDSLAGGNVLLDGVPEQRDKIIDVVIVQNGEGTLLLGGK